MIKEYLIEGVGDTDLGENLIQIIGYQSISGPLGEESASKDDPHALAVDRCSEKRFPGDIRSD